MRHVIRFVLCTLGLIVAIGSPVVFGVAGAANPLAAPGQGTPSPVATPALCGWTVVPAPNQGTSNNFLYAVAARAPDDAWAVGEYFNDNSSRGETLAVHWDGRTWNVVPSPNLGALYNYFHSVAIVAADDAWAVGYYGHGDTPVTLIAHWDGSTWSPVSSPNVDLASNWLTGVAAVSANDVWAVGYYRVGNTYQTLTEHWDGSQWSIVPSLNPGAENTLTGVAAVAANDVWAVGDYVVGAAAQTLTLHWDGSQWSQVPSPNRNTSSFFRGIAAAAANDIWAVGYSYDYPTDTLLTLTAHWDGSQWNLVPSPNWNGSNHFHAVTVASAGDVWAVGEYFLGSADRTLAAHWDGIRWNFVPSPSPGSGLNSLDGVAALGPNDVWAVGSTLSTNGEQQLITHWDGPCPVVTPTPCPVQFSDVAATDPFYPYIRCLACRSILSGYADGTFRPGANVTRGQAAKLIANAAGFTEAVPSTQQTFEDVPSTHPFWVYAERLAGRHDIDGYACGQAPAGPCVPPANRPYFLPGNSVTRGQLAKIDSAAAGYRGIHTNQTFEDVPLDHPFYLGVERVALRGVINGYACGQAPAGPCVPPANRPYFLPANNSTRAQTAKIVANTFYPVCQTPSR